MSAMLEAQWWVAGYFLAGAWVGLCFGYLLGKARKADDCTTMPDYHGPFARPVEHRAPPMPKVKPAKIEPITVSTGDTLVVSYSGFLTKEQREALKAKIENGFMPVAGVRVLILEGGMTLAQYRADIDPNRPWPLGGQRR